MGARRTSARTEEVPRTRAGRLHRARKTPMTMISEITIGETPMETSFVGASAAPSHAPAVKPQRMPRSCRLRCGPGLGIVWGSGRRFGWHESPCEKSVNESQQQESAEKNRRRYPKMNVGEDARRAAARCVARAAAFHGTPVKGTCWPALYTGDNRGNGSRLTGAEGSDDRKIPMRPFLDLEVAMRHVRDRVNFSSAITLHREMRFSSGT